MTLAAQPVVELTAFGLSAGAVFGLFALGLVLIYRTTGILNFAHWGVGLLALIGYVLLTRAGVPAVVAAFGALGLSALLGVAANRLVFIKLERSNQATVILIALGVGQLFVGTAALLSGFGEFTRVPPWLPTGLVRIGDTTLRSSDPLTVLVALACAVGFLLWLQRSRTGSALRALAQNREAATLAGIDDVRYSSLAWAIGSALAALALLLLIPHVGGDQGGLVTGGDLSVFGALLIPAFGAALVGGLVHLPMALAGGVLFGLVREFLILAPKPWSDLRPVIAALLIVVLLLLRTERLFTSWEERQALEA